MPGLKSQFGGASKAFSVSRGGQGAPSVAGVTRGSMRSTSNIHASAAKSSTTMGGAMTYAPKRKTETDEEKV